MGELYVTRSVNNYVRNNLDMSVRSDVYEMLDEKIKEMLINAKKRASMDNRKTIMAKDL